MVSYNLSDLLYLSDMWYTDQDSVPAASPASPSAPRGKKRKSSTVISHNILHSPDTRIQVRPPEPLSPLRQLPPAPLAPPRPVPLLRPVSHHLPSLNMPHFLTRCTDLHPNAPADVPEHGAPFRVYMFRYIVPTLREGIRLLKAHEPEKPLKGLGDLFLGVDSISDRVRVGSSRNVVAVIFEEANRALSYRWARGALPEDPKQWFGRYLLACSAELEG
jgi:hypothetical protein